MTTAAPNGKNPRKVLKLLAFGIGVFFVAFWSLAFPALFPPEWKGDLNKAACLAQDNKLDDADKMFRQGIEKGVAAKVSDAEMTSAYFNFAMFLFEHNRLNEAIDQFKKAAECAHKAGFKAYEAQANQRICWSQHHQFKQGKIKTVDPSYGEKALALWLDKGTDVRPGDLQSAYTQLGFAYADSGNTAKALENFNKGLELAKKENDAEQQAQGHMGIAEVSLAKGDLCQATDSYALAMALLTDEEQLRHQSKHYDDAIARNDDSTTSTKISEEATKLLAAKNWSALDKLADSLRSSKQETINGRWYMDDVYEAIDAIDDRKATDEEWKQHLADLRAWIKANPNSITARVALAEALTSYAWEARGSGWASTVTDDGARKMQERLAESRKVLDEAASLKAKCPRWYHTMDTVALGQGWNPEEYNQMIEAGNKAFPTYNAIYFGKVYHLQPRWYGDGDEWVAYIDDAANKVGGEKGDILYARSVIYLDRMCLSDNLFDEFKSLSWPRVKRGLTALAKKYPTSKRLHAQAAKLAVDGHDKGTAQAIAKAYKV